MLSIDLDLVQRPGFGAWQAARAFFARGVYRRDAPGDCIGPVADKLFHFAPHGLGSHSPSFVGFLGTRMSAILATPGAHALCR